ncbi:hypothetical protein CQA49_08135 [Helicobacter sp. MIT 00-7814]|uniref:ATPase domain-containing protein n=1 Tax=unclassified Helicobacter TaxID=2593540 RepID=UPI000E1FA914|nr:MULTISPECIES: ATPase domain-containing protein [unclassified Helicobacter]RDU51722.1 hypothetical protein CQA37_09410 [Helicobacter sp. MIT 99-10781]RDU52574.1 hypothetical protein CQA49_08135 [Helicobacter sp. MIT 00-7814]
MLELSILRSMIEYPDQIEEFLRNLPPKAFSKKASELLNVILSLQEKNALDFVSFESALSEESKQNDFYINFLNTPPNPNYLGLKELFIQEYQLQIQSQIGQKLLNACNAREVVDIDILSAKYESVSEDFKSLHAWQTYFATQSENLKFKTHIPFLDMCFSGGIEVGQLVLISGDPEAGKTMLGTQILENIAKTHKVCFFCFEFTIKSYLKAKQNSRINLENIIAINDGYDISTIARNIKTLYKQGVKVFLIDSQMRIVSPAGRNMEEEESLKFSTLAKLCHSLDILVFLIVQTSKGDRDNPMGSKKGGHEASIIMRIEHCQAKNELREFSEQERMFIVKKNKQSGKHFKEKVGFNPKTLQFSSLEEQSSDDAVFLDVKEVMEIAKGF